MLRTQGWPGVIHGGGQYVCGMDHAVQTGQQNKQRGKKTQTKQGGRTGLHL